MTLIECHVFNAVLILVRDSDFKYGDLHRLRHHCLETENETSCCRILVNNPAVCVVQMRRYVGSRVGSDPLRRYPGCCSTPIDVRSLPPSSAFLWTKFGLLSTGFPQFVCCGKYYFRPFPALRISLVKSSDLLWLFVTPLINSCGVCQRRKPFVSPRMNVLNTLCCNTAGRLLKLCRLSCTHETTRAVMDGFEWNLMLANFTIIFG
jgi:hypothetical protein